MPGPSSGHGQCRRCPGRHRWGEKRFEGGQSSDEPILLGGDEALPVLVLSEAQIGAANALVARGISHDLEQDLLLALVCEDDVEDWRHGHGTMTYADGRVESGQWENGTKFLG